jgi:TonB-dependent receptor
MGTSLSVAGFHKDIAHEIFSLTTTVQNTTIPGLPGNNYTVFSTTPSNVGSAKVDGVEFGIVKSRMEFLPGPLKGFGFSANATLISMTAPMIQMGSAASNNISFRRLPQLLESSKDIENVSLFYNAGPWGGEIAYNHTGKMPISFDTTNAVNDQWWAATDTVDAQLNYRPVKGVELRLQVKNMFDDKNQKVVGPNQNLNYSLLDNGRAYYLGVGFAF